MPNGFVNDTVFAKNWDFRQDPDVQPQVTAAGQLPIGTGGTPAILVGLLTSPDSSVTVGFSSPNITLEVTGGSTAGKTITGNSGGPISPSGGNWNIITANSTPKFVGAGSTLTLDFNLSNLVLGSALPSATTAAFCVGMGSGVLNSVVNAQGATGFGYQSLNSLVSSSGATAFGYQSQKLATSSINTSFGFLSLASVVTTSLNSAFGTNALSLCVGSNNSAFGYNSLFQILNASGNTAIGSQSGDQYTSTESGNILLGSRGVVGDNNTIRIGNPVTQTQAFLVGVFNTNSGRVVKTTSPGAYPYLTLTTDYVILVDTSSARTINLIASPVTGTTYRIKDNVGSAAANNITITPNAGNIDGSASFVMNANYQAVDLVYNGTQWNKF